MKKLLVLLLTVFALTSCEKDPEIIGIDAEKKMSKVDVCHYDADTDTWKTISISENALKAHLKHGDFEGGCDRLTYVPDNQFEKHLIYLGYDEGPLDGYVLTKNIILVEKLSFGPPTFFVDEDAPNSIGDFTGIEDFANLKKFVALEHHFESLDLSNNKKVEHIGLRDNRRLVNLNISDNVTLQEIEVQESLIVGLDLSKLYNLRRLSIWNNDYLTELNIQNGANKKIYYFSFDGSPLACIQVDDPAWSEANWDNPFPGIYSEDCGY